MAVVLIVMILMPIVKESYLFVTGQWRQSPPYQWGMLWAWNCNVTHQGSATSSTTRVILWTTKYVHGVVRCVVHSVVLCVVLDMSHCAWRGALCGSYSMRGVVLCVVLCAGFSVLCVAWYSMHRMVLCVVRGVVCHLDQRQNPNELHLLTHTNDRVWKI